jgi:hypothetical protein
MTPAKTKTGLSETAKTMLVEWYKEQLYSRRRQVDSKYMTKGNLCEDDSIAMLDPTWVNNKEQFANDYMQGEPDVITDTHIIDIKNSWDFMTFPLFSKVLPSKDYGWQVLGYMELVGRQHGAVIYTLMDTPAELVAYEYKKAGYNSLQVPDDFKAQFQYAHLPKKLRVKRFEVEYDAEKVEAIKLKVDEARKFLACLTF